ncbi:hypothetical protein [Flavivirga spongiicola]|uniref:HMA domain-containing protein n=1 Tax=Flavivirga spongiicola TaxID=421621 RepID=A0ABU7XZ98_9FLAO|nr:hypothetical protein [Flavivirga sp. MEBiC05379]MDO5981111.1 hypothetical protein [Flavivirga sp. MEBiC05379]
MLSFFYYNYKSRTKLFIFKTDIETKNKVKTIKSFLDSHPYIIKWSIDVEHTDNVLKIEARNNLSKNDIISQIKTQGFYCSLLTD